MLNQFYKVSGLKPDLSKFEIVRIGSLKDGKVALCGLKSLDLTKESIKILAVHIQYLIIKSFRMIQTFGQQLIICVM